jgi:nucleoid-associated protein YgaU
VQTPLKRAPIVLLAAAVVIGGTVVALQFRKPAEPANGSAGWVEPSTQAPSTSSERNSPNSTPASPAFAGRVEAAEENEVSPGIASALAELDRKIFPSQNSALNANSAHNSASSHVPQPHRPIDSAASLTPLESQEKTHRIADGDTLPKLAERYLGRADRSIELFEYNRDVLRTQDVLPIGADLRIPPLVRVQTVDPTIHSKDVPRTELTPLFPVYPTPPTQSPTPTASTPPANDANGKAQKPRTYEVKAGDSLVDIARKLYGDGRKHEQLFEANRNVLKNPAALKPGMVLVVP